MLAGANGPGSTTARSSRCALRIGPAFQSGICSSPSPSWPALRRLVPLATLAVLVFLLPGSVPAQFTATNANPGLPGRVIIQGGTLQVAPTLQPALDPQIAAAMQQAGQPAFALAEFDPPVAAAGDRVRYRVVLTASTEAVSLPGEPPVPPGLTLEFVGKGFSYGSGPAGAQPRTTFLYRARVERPGDFTVPAFEANAQARTVTIPAATLRAVAAGAAPPASGPRLVLEAPAETVYVGQSFPIRAMVLDASIAGGVGISPVQLLGDWFITESGTRYTREARNIGGALVQAMIIETTITPIKSGHLAVFGLGHSPVPRNPFGGAVELVNYQPLLDSEPVTVTVENLPREGRLPGFTGGIGRFSVETPQLSTPDARTGEPLSLTFAVRGQGNLSRLVPPPLEPVRGWQVFPPTSQPGGPGPPSLAGGVVFRYTLIPMSDRVRATPPIPLSFFDPQRKAYVDATVPPVALRVTGPNLEAIASSGAAARAASADKPDDTEPQLALAGLMDAPGRVVRTLAPLQTRGWFLGLQAFPALALGGLWWWDRRRRFLATHPDIVRRRVARRGVRRALRQARRAAGGSDAAALVTAGVQGLREAAAPLAGARPEALVCADVLAALPPPARTAEEGRMVRELFAAADRLQFAGAPVDHAGLLALHPRLEALLRQWRERL